MSSRLPDRRDRDPGDRRDRDYDRDRERDRYRERDRERDRERRPRSRSRSPRRDGDRDRDRRRDYDKRDTRDGRDRRDSGRDYDRRDKVRPDDRERDRPRGRERSVERSEASRTESPAAAPVVPSHPAQPTSEHAPVSSMPAAAMEEDEGEVVEEGPDPNEQAMMAMMGFGGFGTTHGKEVRGNDTAGGADVHKQRTWRQYMNRRGGFNRPLDKIK